MQNQLLQMLMNQMKMKNPQMFQMIEQARKNNNNPMEMLKQITNGYNQDQLNGVFDRAKQMGLPEQFINQIKEGIK